MGRNKKTGAFTMPGWDPGQGTGYTPPTTTTLDNGAPILDGEGNYLHDWGYNLNEEGEYADGNKYANTNAGYARYATDRQRDFGISGQNQIDEGWQSYQENAFPQPEPTGGGGGTGGGGVEQNMPAAPAVSNKPMTNYQKGKQLKRESVSDDKSLSWRQSRRLKSGGGQSRRSARQLKRLRNQEARKKQRAKNRRERGWGGFGWNRKR